MVVLLLIAGAERWRGTCLLSPAEYDTHRATSLVEQAAILLARVPAQALPYCDD